MPTKSEEKAPTEHPLRREWRVRDAGGDWLILRSWDVYADENVIRSPLCIASTLGRWLMETAARPVLIDLYRALWGAIEHRMDHAGRRNHLWARLLEEFRGGRLVLVAPKMDYAQVPGKISAGVAQSLADVLAAAKARQDAIKARDDAMRAQKQASKQKTWIGIRLRDQDGKPVPNERYRITLPDGTVQEGTLNDKGEANVYEIDPGQCQVTFPDLHQKEWKPA